MNKCIHPASAHEERVFSPAHQPCEETRVPENACSGERVFRRTRVVKNAGREETHVLRKRVFRRTRVVQNACCEETRVAKKRMSSRNACCRRTRVIKKHGLHTGKRSLPKTRVVQLHLPPPTEQARVLTSGNGDLPGDERAPSPSSWDCTAASLYMIPTVSQACGGS